MKTSRHLFQALFIIVLVVATAVAQSVQWQSLPGPNGATVRYFAKDSCGWLYAASDGGAYRSTNNGEYWELLNLPESPVTNTSSGIYALGCSKVIVDGWYRTYYSTNRGNTWAIFPSDLFNFVMDSVGIVYGCSPSNGVWISRDTATTFTQFALPGRRIKHVLIPQPRTLLCLSDSGLFRSFNGGASWELKKIGPMKYFDLAMHPGGSIFARADTAIYRSDDLGGTWKSVTPSRRRNFFLTQFILAPSQNEIWVATSDGVFYSTNRGTTWFHAGLADQWVYSLGGDVNGEILASTFQEVLLYSRSADQWVERNKGMHSLFITSVAFGKGNTIVAAGFRTIYRSDDGGTSWTKVYGGYPTLPVGLVHSTASGAIFANVGGRLVRSTDDGVSWSESLTPSTLISSIASNIKGTIVVSTTEGKLYRSMDDGASWFLLLDRGKAYPFWSVKATDGGYIYALSDSSIFYFSADGKQWRESGLPPQKLWQGCDINVDAFGTVYASSSKGVLKSNDHGQTWNLINNGLAGTHTPTLATDDRGNVIAATSYGLYRLVNGADRWKALGREGIPRPKIITSVAIRSDGAMFVGTQEGGLFKSLQNLDSRTPTPPETFALFQNYPNPFNATTTIRFDVPISTFVTVKIYNVLGEEVATLVSENSPGRSYTMLWNASPFPSGVYFARLETTQFQRTIKLLLVK